MIITLVIVLMEAPKFDSLFYLVMLFININNAVFLITTADRFQY